MAGARNAAAAVVAADGTVVAHHGVIQHSFALASVTKLLSAYAALIAVEEGVVALDGPAGPNGSTVRPNEGARHVHRRFARGTQSVGLPNGA